jgi:hypothetical protein
VSWGFFRVFEFESWGLKEDGEVMLNSLKATKILFNEEAPLVQGVLQFWQDDFMLE